jgi:radical SAM protein with 4Fe4S-binding SPASM domain
MDYYNLAIRICRIYGSIPGFVPLADGYALPPLFLVLELTYRCNLSCPYCYVHRAVDREKRPELTAGEIDGIVDQTRPWTLIMLSGGEVLVRDDLDCIIRKITQKRRCHVFTNGTLITAGMARQWVDLKLDSVAVSIDGAESVHDAVRGRGTFARAISAIEAIAAARTQAGKAFPLINLKATITAQNAGRLKDIVRLAEETGADYCTFQSLNLATRFGGSALSDNLAYNLPPPPFDDFPLGVLSDQLREISAMRPARVRVRILPELPIQSILDHYANRFDLLGCRCVSPWTILYVSPYGDVFPCLDYRVGNLREQNLQAVWNGRRYRAFRLKLKQRGLFPDCSGCCDLFRRRRIPGSASKS